MLNEVKNMKYLKLQNEPNNINNKCDTIKNNEKEEKHQMHKKFIVNVSKHNSKRIQGSNLLSQMLNTKKNEMQLNKEVINCLMIGNKL